MIGAMTNVCHTMDAWPPHCAATSATRSSTRSATRPSCACRLGAGLTPQLVAKVESLNPGGSIKDRVAVSMIEAAERDGLLRPGGTIVEPTSGNTGTGLAIAARLKGYRVIAVMPDKMCREKIDLLRAYGAEVVIAPTDVAPESPESYYRVAERLAAEIPGAFQPNQYANPANPAAHYATTGPELWEQTGGRITHLVAGVGTGGTISGTARYLKERNPDLVVIGADPEGSIYSGGPRTRVGPTSSRASARTSGRRPSTPRSSTATSPSPTATPSSPPAGWPRRRASWSAAPRGTAVHAALQVAGELDDPRRARRRHPARRRPLLPEQDLRRRLDDRARVPRARGRADGRRRAAQRTAGRRRPAAGHRPRPPARPRRDRPAARARVSQLPVVSANDDAAVVGSIGERGLLAHAASDARLLDAGDRRRDGAAAARGLRDGPGARGGRAAGRRPPGAARHRRRHAAGIVTRADLLEALAR